MFRRSLIGFVFAGALAFHAAAADVVIRVAPPRVLVEKRSHPPSRNHAWVSGYHRWEGNSYAWQPGRWEPRPHGHSRWVAHHYVRRNGGWVLVEGHWR